MKIRYLYIKRGFDLALSTIALILLSPLLLFIASIMVVIDGLPIIHWSQRVGINGHVFKMPKFRTMKTMTPVVASDQLKNPISYITRVGGFLRKTSIDELPQLWSILVGDMSIVGPRPALINQAKLNKLRDETRITTLKPGLTGLAQINGRDKLTDEHKVYFDEMYLKNISFYLDLKIIFLTFLQVIFGKNVSH